jgi:transcriptional regulator with XRE-family HTH domain
MVGVSEATVSRWESGDIANMRRDRIALLASALRTTPGFVMTGREDDESPAIPEDDKALLEEVSANPELMNLLRILKQIEPDRLAALAKLVEPML